MGLNEIRNPDCARDFQIQRSENTLMGIIGSIHKSLSAVKNLLLLKEILPPKYF